MDRFRRVRRDGTEPGRREVRPEFLTCMLRAHAKGQAGTRQSEFKLDTQLSAGQERAVELLKGIRA